MRILQVVHGFLPQFRGGTELYLLGLARELRQQGHEVEIVSGTTHTAESPHCDLYEHEGFRVHKIVLAGSYLEHWTRSFSPAASRLFEEVVREVQPDIVHVQHWYRLSRNLIEICEGLGVPAVCTLHDLWTSCPRIFRIREETFCERSLGSENCVDCVARFPWMDDATTGREIDSFHLDFQNELRLAHRIIVPSRAHGELLESVIELPRDRLIVLPHGTITELYSLEAPAEAKTAEEPRHRRTIRLGVWGHLFHMKGVHLVLEALQRLERKHRFGVHVWGRVIEPNYKKRLERAAQGLDVTWHGAYSPEDLARVPLDVAVIPSLCSESFSFVLDEAFKLGLPAIVPDRGALAERIESAGVTFEPESDADLAQVFDHLLDSENTLAMWKRAIPELTSMAWHTRELIHVYEEVIGQQDLFEPVEDRGLLQGRMENLAISNAENERLIFGYLGHIKRETGRGDHLEGAVKEMTALVEVMAGEIEGFRRAMIQDGVEEAVIERKQPEGNGITGHIPGLGTVSDLCRADDEVLAQHSRAVIEKQQRSDRIVQELARSIENLRRALTAVFRDGAEFELVPADAEGPEIDVPGLGDLKTVDEVNLQLIRQCIEEIARLKAQVAEPVDESE